MCELVQRLSARVEGHRAADRRRNRPKLIDTVAVIAVRMGDDDGIEAPDLGTKQLLAQVRSAIDEHALPAAFDENRRAQPKVSRLGRIAESPIIADLRNTGGRPTAENADFHAFARLKSRKKFS